MLRAKMGQASFEFFQRTFCLSVNKTLMVYSSADASRPDGPMMETIAQVSQMMDEMGIDSDDLHREGNLSWDSHTI